MIIITYFDPNFLSKDKISFKSTDAVVYNIKYITMKSPDNENIDCENPLCLIFNDVNGYIIEESNRYKYLIFVYTKNNKKVLRKYNELWDKIKNQIEIINSGESIKHKNNFMRIRFYSNYLPLGRILSIPVLIVVVKSTFQNDNKYYPQVYIQECGYE